MIVTDLKKQQKSLTNYSTCYKKLDIPLRVRHLDTRPIGEEAQLKLFSF